MKKAMILVVLAILIVASSLFLVFQQDLVSSFKLEFTGFAGYSNSGLANLTIWDETDSVSFPYAGKTRFIDDEVIFFANYTNSTGSPITAATVTACFDFSKKECNNMSYNSTSKLWYLRKNIYYYGIIGWSVNATSTTPAASLLAHDNMSINNTCLNISLLTTDYYMKTSRVVCSGVNNVAESISVIFDNVSSIDLTCNDSIINGSEGGWYFIDIKNKSTNIKISDCLFKNFDGRTINVDNSNQIHIFNNSFFKNSEAIYFNNVNNSMIKDCLFNNISGIAIQLTGHNNEVSNIISYDAQNAIIVVSNSTSFHDIKLYNGSLGILINVYVNMTLSDNEAYNIYVENYSEVGFVAWNQGNFYANNITVKNSNICFGIAEGQNSAYSDISLSNCNTNALLFLYNIFSTNVQDVNIYNSNNTIGFLQANISPTNSIKNINVSDSKTLFYFENSTVIGRSIYGIHAENISLGANSINSTVEIYDSFINLSTFVDLRKNSNITLINVTGGISSSFGTILDTSKISVKYYIKFLIKDVLDNAISNANISLYNNKTKSLLFSELSNSQGYSSLKNLTISYFNSTGIFSPVYNLSVFNRRYVPYSDSFDLSDVTESQTIQIVLLGNDSISVKSPVDGFYYNKKKIDLNYTVLYSNIDKCWFINVTGHTKNLPGCINTTFNAREGENDISIFANSTDGNLTFSRIYFNVDTIFPSITKLDIDFITNTSVNISWTFSEETNISFKFWKAGTSSTINFINSSFSKKDSFYRTGLDSHSLYRFNITSCDRAGNCIKNESSFSTPTGNFTPRNLHIPEEGIIVQELYAVELTSEGQKSSLTPGSKYIFTIDGVKHEVRLKQVYMDNRAVFEFRSDPVTEEINNGSSVDVDLDKDGVKDIRLSIENIEMTRVDFQLKRISTKKIDEVDIETQPKKEVPGFLAEPDVNEKIVEAEKSFMEKYWLPVVISLVVLIAVIAGGGAFIIQKRKPLVVKMQLREKPLPVPKTSNLENLLTAVYGMLKDKSEEDIKKYLDDLNLEENLIKSITFEMNTKNNKLDELIKFTKRQFNKGKSVREVRDILEEAGWANNIIKLVTEE